MRNDRNKVADILATRYHKYVPQQLGLNPISTTIVYLDDSGFFILQREYDNFIECHPEFKSTKKHKSGDYYFLSSMSFPVKMIITRALYLQHIASLQ
jgi:hypothetical protein